MTDPAKRALYYARVIEIPTPRHALLDAIALQIDAKAHQPVSGAQPARAAPTPLTPEGRRVDVPSREAPP